MAGDDPQVFGLFAQEFRRPLAHVPVAGAMEAVAADFQALVVFIGHAVQVRLGGHGLMEGGIKHGHHGGAGHDLLAGLDAHQVGGVMQGAQGDVFRDGVQHSVVDDDGFGELAAAVEHPMAHRADFVHAAHLSA